MKNIKSFFSTLFHLQNFNIYFITCIISGLLMVPSLFKGDILTILSGIGCSGVAAALMATFVDLINENKCKEKIKSCRNNYLSGLYSETRKFAGQFLWMSRHLEDDWFGWDLLDGKQFFTTIHHSVVPKEKYDLIADKQISNEEAIKELKTFSHDKFEWGKAESLDPKIKERLSKMCKALYEGNQDLIQEAIQLNKNKLYMDSEGYLSLEDTDYLYKALSTMILSINPNSNYSLELCPSAVAQLLEKLTEITEKNEKIIIGRHTTFFAQ